MTVIMHEAAPLLSVAYSANDATKARVHFGLQRCLASEVVSDELYDVLETVLGQYAVRPSVSEAVAITQRLREAATKLVDVVPRLIKSYTVEQQVCTAKQLFAILLLSAAQPGPDDMHGHLVRFASSILTILDQLGDVAS